MIFTNTTRAEHIVHSTMDYRVYHLVRDQANFVCAKVNVAVNWYVGDQICKIRNTIEQEIK
jgi:hypothetical protein